MRIHTGIWLALSGVLITMLPAAAVAGPPEAASGVVSSLSPAVVTAEPPAPDGAAADAAEVLTGEADAEEVLDAAEEVFEGAEEDTSAGSGPSAAQAPAPGEVADPDEEVHVTAILRQLSMRLGELDRGDRRTARQILARPTSPRTFEQELGIDYQGAATADTCAAPGGEDLHVCVHWVTDATSPHAPDLGTGDVPPWVRQTQRIFEEVWSKIVGDLRYRRPVGDGAIPRHGPDQRPDVYLAELGRLGAYGFCAPEGAPSGPRAAPASGYCVVDNDFLGYSGRPVNDLKVTAAHEFFHLVQFAYTNKMDYWVAEGTAAWVEDEVYDAINDNLQYLSRGAMSVPQAPLDFVPDPTWAYSSWIWWRFLSEYVGRPGRPDPSVVRQLWNKLAARPNGSATPSLVALRRVLAQRRKPFAKAFGDFTMANRVPHRWYDEGRSYRRYAGRPGRRHVLTNRRRYLAPAPVRVSHLATEHVLVRPGRGLAGRWRLRVAVDLPRRFRGSKAGVTLHLRNGRVRRLDIGLNRRGDGARMVPFDRRRVAALTLTLTNASTRIRSCGRGTAFSCGGIPRDDNLPYRYRLRVRR